MEGQQSGPCVRALPDSTGARSVYRMGLVPVRRPRNINSIQEVLPSISKVEVVCSQVIEHLRDGGLAVNPAAVAASIKGAPLGDVQPILFALRQSGVLQIDEKGLYVSGFGIEVLDAWCSRHGSQFEQMPNETQRRLQEAILRNEVLEDAVRKPDLPE